MEIIPKEKRIMIKDMENPTCNDHKSGGHNHNLIMCHHPAAGCGSGCVGPKVCTKLQYKE